MYHLRPQTKHGVPRRRANTPVSLGIGSDAWQEADRSKHRRVVGSAKGRGGQSCGIEGVQFNMDACFSQGSGLDKPRENGSSLDTCTGCG